MTVYVLDSSALLRYIDDELGAARVEQILKACVAGSAGVWISALQWGEVAGNLRKRFGANDQARILSTILPSEAEIVPVNADRAVRAAELKVDHKIAFADSVALELATHSTDHVLVTADYGFKPVAALAKIEFLPSK
jgi:PIN domain nuclease of toxin-antitoxin system